MLFATLLADKITPPSRCISTQCSPFTLTMGYQILLLTVCSFSSFWVGLSVCKVPLPSATFLALVMFCKLLSILWIWTPGTTFDSSIHLGVSNVQADSLEDPTCFQIHIKCSKMDSFPVGCNISRSNNTVCPVVAISNFFLPCVALPKASVLFCRCLSLNTPVAVIYSTQQCQGDCQITWLKLWVNATSVHQLTTLWRSPAF